MRVVTQCDDRTVGVAHIDRVGRLTKDRVTRSFQLGDPRGARIGRHREGHAMPADRIVVSQQVLFFVGALEGKKGLARAELQPKRSQAERILMRFDDRQTEQIDIENAAFGEIRSLDGEMMEGQHLPVFSQVRWEVKAPKHRKLLQAKRNCERVAFAIESL